MTVVYLLPFALGVVMLGLGLSLVVEDFRRAARHPGVVLIALTCQVVVLPLLCWTIVEATGLAHSGADGAYMAAGFLLLAASPGGATASLFSHLFRGDVALSVTLLAVNSVISVFTMPVVVNLAIDTYLAGQGQIGLQPMESLQIFAIVLIPVAVGMLLRRRAPEWAARMDQPVRIGSVALLVLVIIGAVAAQGRATLPYLGTIGAVAVMFCLVNLTVGYAVPRLLQVRHSQAVAISMEIGVHNETLAITIALAVLAEPRLAVPAAFYSLIKFAIIPIFGWAITRKRDTVDGDINTETSGTSAAE